MASFLEIIRERVRSWSLVLRYSNPITGESAMDRLACALGGKTMLPHILTNVNNMLGHGESSL